MELPLHLSLHAAMCPLAVFLDLIVCHKGCALESSFFLQAVSLVILHVHLCHVVTTYYAMILHDQTDSMTAIAGMQQVHYASDLLQAIHAEACMQIKQ